MSDSSKDISAQVAEATKIRAQLERLAAKGEFDLSNPKHAEAHQRLDELERFLHTMRNR